jgi:hypothetical protein
MNRNCFSLNYPNVSIDGLSLSPGEEREMKLELSFDGGMAELDGFPYHIDCALKVLEDAYVFRIPCSLTVAMVPNAPAVSFEEYKELVSNPDYVKRQEVLDHSLGLEQFVQKMQDNNLIQIFRQDQETGHEKMAYACELVNGLKMVTEIIFDKATSAVNMRLTGPTDAYVSYFHHALSIIANL